MFGFKQLLRFKLAPSEVDMNAVEIEEAVSQLASEPFDAREFPFAFLKAFDNKDTTIAKLRSGASNSSDIPGGVLQRNNIHIATCKEGETTRALTALKSSPKTTQSKARFILTTDGTTFEAEDLTTGETIACSALYHCGYSLTGRDSTARLADPDGCVIMSAGASTSFRLPADRAVLATTRSRHRAQQELIAKDSYQWAVSMRPTYASESVRKLRSKSISWRQENDLFKNRLNVALDAVAAGIKGGSCSKSRKT